MNFNVISPNTTEELLELISENQGNKFRFGAGYTDLILELKKQPYEKLTVINLAQLNDNSFTSIQKCDDGIRIGALVTVNKIILDPHLSGEGQFSLLKEAANKLASRQIRQVATVGGNLCTASPAGDIACALVALEAQCEILSTEGTLRVVPANDFFTGVRKTDLKKDEVLQSVFIPFNKESNKTFFEYIKVGTRRSMECSVVSLAYYIHTNEKGIITYAGIAIGSVAPTIKFTNSACEFLKGKIFSLINQSESKEFALKIMEYASPISDIRASAWYREEVLFNISQSIFKT